MKQKNRQKLKQVIMIFAVIINILNVVTLPIPYREKFDESIAEELLRETYLPLVDFVKSGTPIEGEELLLAPNDIRNESDFKRLFYNMIDNRLVEEFYDHLVIEKQGVLYIDKMVYIPNIYAESGKLTNSYIKKWNRSLYSYFSGENDAREEQLIIKEKWEISGEWSRRSNYFVKSHNGEWILDSFTGTGRYKFVDSSHNPWNYY